MRASQREHPAPAIYTPTGYWRLHLGIVEFLFRDIAREIVVPSCARGAGSRVLLVSAVPQSRSQRHIPRENRHGVAPSASLYPSLYRQLFFRPAWTQPRQRPATHSPAYRIRIRDGARPGSLLPVTAVVMRLRWSNCRCPGCCRRGCAARFGCSRPSGIERGGVEPQALISSRGGAVGEQPSARARRDEASCSGTGGRPARAR